LATNANITGSERPMIAGARPVCCSARTSLPSVSPLRSWVNEAKPGERFTYHRGFLTVDRAGGSPLTDRERVRLDILAKDVLAAAEVGLLHLLQRRLGTGAFRYIAVKAHQDTGAGRAG
jgi:hypothetical protein